MDLDQISSTDSEDEPDQPSSTSNVMFEKLKQGEAQIVRRKRSRELRLTPTVSFHALSRAQTTIEDFVSSYFHFHDLVVPKDFFRFLPILVFVEATIYQMDEENEDLCNQKASVSHEEEVSFQGEAALMSVLEQEGLLDDRIREELDKGRQYWAAERNITRRWAEKDSVTIEEVLACSLSKSFDYRVLNLLLYRLTERPYDEALLRFLCVDEHLVDINDDLVDYEKATDHDLGSDPG